MYSEKDATINVLSGVFNGAVDLEPADLTGVPDLISRARIFFNYSCVWILCWNVDELILFFSERMWQLTIRRVEALRRASIFEWQVGPLKSTLRQVGLISVILCRKWSPVSQNAMWQHRINHLLNVVLGSRKMQ